MLHPLLRLLYHLRSNLEYSLLTVCLFVCLFLSYASRFSIPIGWPHKRGTIVCIYFLYICIILRWCFFFLILDLSVERSSSLIMFAFKSNS